jgi:hypoxanthine phosphoribosyltransferase
MHVGRTLIARDRIAARVAEMGREISAELQRTGATPGELSRAVPDMAGGYITLVPVLTGALVFVADLIRAMPVQLSIRPITASSYPGATTVSTGTVTLQGGVPTDLRGQHVLIVDDIFDTGRTLGLLRRVIEAQKPASVRIAVLLSKRKPGGRHEDVPVEHVGFEIDDEFVIGYGLDYDGLYRNLPDICVLEL